MLQHIEFCGAGAAVNPQGPVTHEAWLAHLRGVLLEADQSFIASGDVMEALSWVAFAARHGLAIPPVIGAWIATALDGHRTAKASYQRTSLDKALGLTAQGKDVGLELAQRSAVERSNSAMFILHSLGATIAEAATIVASTGGAKSLREGTIADRFTRSGLGPEARESRRAMCAYFRLEDLEKTLAAYPDGDPAVDQAKAAIRKVYAKHRL
jgi:hypothetical protein